MTALDRYVRLEAQGEWRAPGAADWREVLVSFGNATLVLSDFSDHPLTHWSLAATRAVDRTTAAVTYAPDMDSDEALRIADPQMNAAIAEVTAMARGIAPAPQPRRRRWGLILAAVSIALAAGFGPGLLRTLAVDLLPEDRADLLDTEIRTKVTGRLCTATEGRAALGEIVRRIAPGAATMVLDQGHVRAERLPGGTLALSRATIESAATPDELAGWISLARHQPADAGPYGVWVAEMPLTDLFHFLISAEFRDRDLAAMAATLDAEPPAPRTEQIVAAARDVAELGHDPRGFVSAARASFAGLGTFELSPPPADTIPLIDDQSWVALQGICG